MKMFDTGHKVPDYGMPSTSGESGERKMKTVYPEIHVEGDSLPKLPEGEFMMMVKAKKVGFRDPADEGSEKSCDIAILGMQPMDHDDEEQEESPLRKSVRKRMEY